MHAALHNPASSQQVGAGCLAVHSAGRGREYTVRGVEMEDVCVEVGTSQGDGGGRDSTQNLSASREPVIGLAVAFFCSHFFLAVDTHKHLPSPTFPCGSPSRRSRAPLRFKTICACRHTDTSGFFFLSSTSTTISAVQYLSLLLPPPAQLRPSFPRSF